MSQNTRRTNTSRRGRHHRQPERIYLRYDFPVSNDPAVLGRLLREAVRIAVDLGNFTSVVVSDHRPRWEIAENAMINDTLAEVGLAPTKGRVCRVAHRF